MKANQSGRVTIVGEVEDSLRRVTLFLPPSWYDDAIFAHREGIPVVCLGELVREGRSYVLRNPHGFSLLNNSDDADIPFRFNSE